MNTLTNSQPFAFRNRTRGRSHPIGHVIPRPSSGTIIPAAAPFRPVPGTTDPRPVVAVDWSQREIVTTRDGIRENITRYPTLGELLDALTVPHCIALEATFESWDPDRRAALILAARDAGHDVYTLNPRHTRWHRRAWEVEKSDVNDALTIYRIATRTSHHLAPISDPDPAWVAKRELVNTEYLGIRLAGRKPELAAAAIDLLGRYRDLPADRARVLGNSGKYAESLLAATWHAAQYATSREEFERLLGLHAAGYPSLLRSDLHHHYYRHARKRGVTWSEVRREIRTLWALFKAARPKPELTARPH